MDHNPAPPAAYSVYSTEHQFTLAGMLRFELCSLIGRWLLQRRPPELPAAQLLNLGCGTHCHPDFVNADFFRLRGARGCPNFWALDLRYPLPCAANHWDGVLTEHTLEHLHPHHVRALLREIYRTLKPGGWVRIVVPDVAKYVAYYNGQPSEPAFEKWRPRAAALRSVAQNYLHLSLWDEELLTACVAEAGFAHIVPRNFGTGADPRLLKDTPGRRYESLYLEARKNGERAGRGSAPPAA